MLLHKVYGLLYIKYKKDGIDKDWVWWNCGKMDNIEYRKIIYDMYEKIYKNACYKNYKRKALSKTDHIVSKCNKQEYLGAMAMIIQDVVKYAHYLRG